MKAFMMSLAALVLITAAAAIGLGMVPMSAEDVYTARENVRL